jgi:nicotinate dehydrogenase subunit A
MSMAQKIKLHVNGRAHNVEVEPETPLLYVLRNDLELNGPRYGCGYEQCGVCMALVNGVPLPTCKMPVASAVGKTIRTLEDLGTEEKPHPLQRAFIQEQAAQCGYCISGAILCAHALLEQKPKPSERDIRLALERVLCRCGTHARIIRAVQRAAKEAGA